MDPVRGKGLSASSTPEKRVNSHNNGNSNELNMKSSDSQAPKAYDSCVHQMFQDRARAQPEALAICAWDAQFTYAELDSLSTSLAAHLAQHGVGPEVYVPIYSEKSCWVPAAMLAVLKAGGAFVLLEPAHPMTRLEEICRTVGATRILASKQYARNASLLAPEIFITGVHTAPQPYPVAVNVYPSNAAYAIFTSGSSGRPKGVAIEHRAFVSSAVAHAAALHMDQTSRVLQFASVAFDACLTEMLTALLVGACVCIPSEVGRRSDLAGEARRLQPNWALLTPSVARILDVTDFTMLRTLILGGEAITEEDVRKWAPHTDLFVAYGVSEAAVVNLARPCHVEDKDYANIGFGVGVTCWLTDPDDHDRLAAEGAVGELVLSGPAVGRGYIGDVVRTAAAFIDAPLWYRQQEIEATSDMARSKLYKTGDLCAYNPTNGSIRYIGRKDAQVKIHGQRLEVSEVEHSLRPLLPEARHTVVDVVKLDGFEALVAFVLPETQSTLQHVIPGDPWLLDPNSDFRTRTQAAQQRLQGTIPQWMIPSVFLPLKYMPLMPSGKSDRRALRSLAATLTQGQLQSYGAAPARTAKREPSTPMEKVAQQLWASVLRLPASHIGLDDNFMDLGGTSIQVMKLAGAARRRGLLLDVSDAFRHGSLAEMAASLKPVSTEEPTSLLPFALIHRGDARNALIDRALQICGLQDRSEIGDLYPCTPMQEGLMSLTARRPGAYTAAFEYELPIGTDAGRFRQAWDVVVGANPILRTRFIQSSSGIMYQAVIRGTLSWESDISPDSVSGDWQMGRPLVRFGLRQRGDQYVFIFIIHHALSDGWALPLLLEQAQAAYNGAVSLPPRPFNHFIDYISKADYKAFWGRYFDDSQVVAFPPLPSVSYTPDPTARKTLTIQVDIPGKNECSVPNRLKLAWAVLISLYTDSVDTIFGVTVAGRGAPVLGIDDMTGPTIASVPYRLCLDPAMSVSDSLQKVQDDSIDMMPFEQAGLQYISRLTPEAAAACSSLQSLLVIQPHPADPPQLFRASKDLAAFNAFSTYPINLICQQLLGSVEIDATFDPKVVDETQFCRMLHQLRHIFQQLSPSQGAQAIRDLDTTSPEDWIELTEWNKTAPDPAYTCAHDLVRKQCELRPQAPAVCAWDGDFSYSDVDELSSSLAAYLMEHGVGPEVFVPLCFEKTRWVTIAMLGVSKAGGAFVLLDPTHPAKRLEGICRDSKAPFVISSELHAGLASRIAARSIIINRDWNPSEAPKASISVPHPAASPENSIYAVFTSGSTGTPKGAKQSHISWCTSALANRAALYLGPESRVLQFSSYAFDVSIADNLLTLISGGCVCVPRNEDIQGGHLAKAINELGVNWACITPSVARIIDPLKVPTLKTLGLAGEPSAPEIISLWLPHVHLLNVYGPAECCILTTVHRNIRDFRDPNNIGFPTAAVCWVVDPKNEQRLAPIGTVGELLVESPIVGRGYVNDPERTAESFITRDKYPKWLSKFRPDGTCNLYRTGDLVKYTKDGSLRYMGRSATQIKLRGQRIELGELEYHLRQCFPEAQEVVAEIISRKKGGPVLTAFILPKPQMFRMSDERFQTLAAEATRELELLLPTYMIPTVFVPVEQLPYSKSGKLDRKLLRTMAADLPLDEYTKPAGRKATRENVAPVSEDESVLLELFSFALKIAADDISTADHFVKLGGDSIVAMHLVALAKDRGLLFSAADIFKNPTISSLAKKVQRHTSSVDHRIQPLSLLRKGADREQIEKDAVEQNGVRRDEIEDIYPCTPLQEGMMSLSVKRPGMYIARFRYNIPKQTDLARFQNAWNQVLGANSILRTRLIQSGEDGIFQVVLKDLPPWGTYGTVEEQEIHSNSQQMTLGSPLLHLSLAPMADGTGSYHFLLTIHHSLYDGWSFPLLWKQVLDAYRRQEISPQPFNRFIQHIMQVDGTEDFWKSQMSDLNSAQFPPLPHVGYSPNPNQSLSHVVDDLPTYKGEHTLSVMVQLAWAVVLSHYTDSDDVVFGQTSNGRSAAMEGIAEMAGPTVATFPLRVALDKDKTVENSLVELQQQTVALIPYMQSGLHNIRRINDDTARACDFQTHIVVQPASVMSGMDLGGLVKAEEESFASYEGFASYAFVMLCHQQEGSQSLQITVNYDSSVIQIDEAQRLVEQFHGVLRQIFEKPSHPIREVDVISKEDLAQLAAWNGTLPSRTYESLHDLVLRHCRERPDAEAVSSWDGVLTYRQLDDWSARLAQHLLTFGLQPEAKVAACLQKSCWTVVTFLAVLRAGCTCVIVDPGHPRGRILDILERAAPELVVASEGYETLVQGINSRSIFISSALVRGLPSLAVELPIVTPDQAAFILFTSGSTGTPKGIVMEHSNWSTSVAYAGVEMGFSQESRALHFASYAFDASIYEIFNTLAYGGCLCVASEHDRMNNLASFIRDQRVNLAILTPSTLALMEPEDVPTLKSLIAGGEALTRDVVSRWAGKVSLINGYGPAESMICSTHPVSPTGWRFGTIGPILGGRGWIVDRSNHNKLAAIGAVGELIVEGPVVTRGYLNEPEKTAAAYIEPPQWMQDFRPKGTEGRLYKSGDLVQYNPDSSLRFVGRKGLQVKLRGQRIELQECEYHLKKCFPVAAEVVAEIVTPADGKRAPFLVAAILVGESADNVSSLFYEPTSSFLEMAQKAKQEVSNLVPSYMVPEVFLPLRRIPVSRSSKLDRRQLREACASLTPDQIQEYLAKTKVAKRAPSTSTERTLQKIWARVLGMEASSIGVDDNWMALGGDSIQAMRVVSQSAAAGLKTSVRTLFDEKTIAKISLATESLNSTPTLAAGAERLNVPFDLSPIQQMFFDSLDSAGTHYNHFNQSLAFRLSKSVSSETVQGAIDWLVANHSMFRARFNKKPNGQWRQSITSETGRSYSYRESTVGNQDEAAALFQSDQTSLDIELGPLFICHYMHVGKEKQTYLSLTVHHLVVDIVSWHIILSDIETLLTGQQKPVLPPLSFQTWSRLQSRHAAKNLHPDQVLPNYNKLNVPKDYWKLDTHPNTWGDVIQDEFVLTEGVTRALIGNANDALRTRPVEILHAVLLQAFASVFTDRPVPTIFSEGHGREPWDPNLNPSWTVGWFTTLWPADVSVQPGDSLTDIVARTKDARRKVKNNGWAYFNSRYSHSEGAARFKMDGPMEILFNYHQGFAEDKASVLQQSTLGDEAEQISPKLARFALIDVLADVRDSKLSFKFLYNRHMEHRQSIRDWIEQTKRYLGSAAITLPHKKPAFTSSDYPLLKYSQSEMETFNKTIATPLSASSLEIEDAYKCSPIQDGFMLSQSKVPGQYTDKFFWSVKSRDGSPVLPERLQEAWQQVLQRHPLLRTVLYENPSHNGHYDQLVLKRPPPDMSVILPTSSDPVQQLERHRFDISSLSPPHRLAICSSPYGDVECMLEINHAVVDGYSRQLFMRDLSLAYEGKLDVTPRGAYHEYVEYINSRPVDESMAYWERYLGSVEPCSLPPSPPSRALDQNGDATRVLNFLLPFGQELREFSSQHGTTLANIFQIAWALVLGRYVNSDSVCFGYMTSERGLPIAHLDETVGPIINTHICRVGIGADKPVLDMLRDNQDSYVQSLTHQHISIVDRMRSAKLPTSTLFNTIMSVQTELGGTDETSALVFGDDEGTNTTEYDMLLNIGVLQHGIDVSWEYSSTFMSDERVRYISDAFQQALLSIISKPQQTAKNVNLLGDLSKQLIGKINGQEALPVDEFVDKLIEKRCLAQPSAQAVNSWDGNFTYGELNELSDLAAAQLKTRGVGPNSVVLLCFEKSRWNIVAQLAVLKAGGAFLPLDPSHPVERLKDICKEAGASVVLTSEEKSALASQLAPQVLLVDEHSIKQDNPSSPFITHTRDPTDLAYVIFTSGSTGKPKGAILPHRALATSSIAHGTAFLMDTDSRVAHFASHAFDLAVLESLTTLVMGACICIPSDTQKQDIVGSVASFQANWVFFTPALARVLDPSDFKTLRTVVFGGDSITEKEVSIWRSKVNLFFGYGPTECTIIDCAQLVTEDVNDSRLLGPFLGSNGWVVRPDDPGQLVPVGAVGELLIEGPVVGLGYLNDPEKTAAAFIEPPRWLAEFRGNRPGRMYKTGDLVRCLENGVLQFLGRKDLQVKLRGNRVELGEVEWHLRASFSNDSDAIVEIVSPADGRQPMIVAFVCPRNSESQVDEGSGDASDGQFMKASLEFSIQAQNAESQMSKSLPTYMTPTIYLPLHSMPLTANKKVDRKKLREAAALLSPQQLEQYDFFSKPNETPTTSDESLIQQVWARVLERDPESIGLHTNFFRLGGDSISAMQIATQCTAAGITVKVADIFRHKTISGLSAALQTSSSSNPLPEKISTPLSNALSDSTSNSTSPTELEFEHQDTPTPLTPPVQDDYMSRLEEQLAALRNEYWKNYLKDVTPCHFPIANEDNAKSVEDTLKTIEIDVKKPSTVHKFCKDNKLTLANVCQVAWSIVLRYYINSDSVCFGYLSEGGGSLIPYFQGDMEPSVNTLACRMDLSSSTSLMSALQQNQISCFNGPKYQHPLADILRAARVPSDESLFNTVLSFQNVKKADANRSSLFLNFIEGEESSKYDIAVDIAAAPQRITVALTYRKSVLPDTIAHEIADTLRKTIYEIAAKPGALVSAIDVVSERSRQLLRNWSGILPPASSDLVHDLIHQQCLAQPDKTAVEAWDGQFTYSEVDELSSKLASHLAQYALEPDMFVAVCFEKSKWTPVIMLAILKAGAAFVLLDPSQPSQRLQYVCQTTKASVVIASEEQTALATTFAKHTVTVSDHIRDWTNDGATKVPSLSPNNTAFAVFTSGSTGKPKGVQISHSAFVTSAKDHSIALKITQDSRVFQFASHSFDASVAENFTTLLVGGCVCIPSERERKESLAEAVSRMQANFLFITPALARVLDPDDFPSLETLIVGGELITEKELNLWMDKVDLHLAYGPTECTVFATATKRVTAETNGRNVGTTINCRSWVVDPRDHDRLLPVGAIGELLLEGPTVAGGYIGQPEQTAAVFIDRPPWLKAFNDKPSRSYKTGDLVRYNADGTLHFIGRKDNQIKLRGQRLELGEVEFQVRAQYCRPIDVAVELVIPDHKYREPYLVAFIYPASKEPPTSDEMLARPSSEFCAEAQATQRALNERLPSYMVPTLFLPLQRIPLSANQKINRHILRQLANKLSLEDFLSYTARATTKSVPANDKEIKPQSTTPATPSIPLSASAPSANTPFGLMSDKVSAEALVELAADQCDVPATHIEDVYPTTPLQEGLIALTIKRPGQCIATFKYELAEGVDVDRFVAAWNATVTANAILRTRIIQSDSLGFLQVVVRDLVSWKTFNDEQAFERHIEGLDMGLATQLVDFALIRPGNHDQKGVRFYLTIHHALYDGGSLPRLLSQVEAAYRGEAISSAPFSRFIEYVLTAEGADNFWKSEFEDLTAPIFPALPSPRYSPDPSTTSLHNISTIQRQSSDYTTSTVIKLAWAMVVSCYTDSEDVVHGITVSGGNSPVEGIEDITGPTFATFPVRTRVHRNDTVQGVLESIQEKTFEMMPFQQFGMQNMRQLSPEAARACEFQCHLAIQPPAGADDAGDQLLVDVGTRQAYGDASNCVLMIVCHLPAKGETDMLVAVSYDKDVIEPSQAARMVQQFEHILCQVELSQQKPEAHSIRLGDLDLLSPEDRQQLATWNSELPPAENSCLHELVLQHAAERPSAPAICAWDGELTFGELDVASAILSQQLQSLGIQAGSLVPLLFNKSKWAVITMIALHRVGAACVNIDPTYPRERIQDIIDRTQAKFILGSREHTESLVSETTTPVTVPIQGQQPRAEDFAVPHVNPHDIAFVTFTAGTTGDPKGVLVEHTNVTSSIRGYSAEARLDQNTRGLHFASYASEASIFEIYGVLIHGGCVCIPDDCDRVSDVAPFVNRHAVNWAFFTSSCLALLRPDSIPTIRTILVGGEAISFDNARTWASKVNLVTGYGLAETAICAAGRLPESWKPGNLGRATGSVAWVTMPSDRSRLAPIGTPGELAIEGPVITRGYLGEPEQTDAAYVSNPSWLRPFREGQDETRVFFTGDIVQYNADGTIVFLGRANTEATLRGQRVRLGEVEHHVRHAFDGVTDAVAEVVRPNGGDPKLIAFVANGIESPEHDTDKLLNAPTEDFVAKCEAATRKLADVLPAYMLPALFLQLPEIPRTSSNKANRQLLREQAAKLSQEEIQAFSDSQPKKKAPKTEEEKLLLSLWAQTFKVSQDAIGVDDSFLSLGDSIAAIRLSGVARQHGVNLPVSQIFQYPILSEQARAMTATAPASQTEEYKPGSLLGISNVATFFEQNLSGEAPLYKAHDVEDILPTTSIQSSMIKINNITYSRLQMNTQVDVARLEEACRAVVRKHASLRTVFVPYRDAILQVVLRTVSFDLKQVECEQGEDLWEYATKWCTKDGATPVPFGSLAFLPILISRSTSEHILVIRMTHALYDGGSFPLISKDITLAYNGTKLESDSPSFAEYMHYRKSQNTKETHHFWREYLAGAEISKFNLLPPNTAEAEYEFGPIKKCPLPTFPDGITMATFVKAVWAVVVARTTKRKDVVFAHLISGRDVPLPNAEEISGPCITPSPIRVSMQEGWSMTDLLKHVQEQYTRAMPYTNIDFRDILQHATPWPADTEFGSIVTHEDANIDLSGSVESATSEWETFGFGLPHFNIITYPRRGQLWVKFGASNHKMHPSDVERLMDQFIELLARFSEDVSQPLQLGLD
ncbi:hypothetical protein ANO14919_087960 [Xylariales sp. No.14919]|nr:hypothetical protein ANO14919_087960 [Xylariales sp. No.14919]